MASRHVWVIEWFINQWEPRHSLDDATKKQAMECLRSLRRQYPKIQYRLKKYVRQE